MDLFLNISCRRNAAFYSLAVVALTIGCGTWLRNPKKPATTSATTMSLRFTGDFSHASSDKNAIPVTDTKQQADGELTVTAAEMVVREISLTHGGEDQEIGGGFPGPYIADLLAQTVSPEIATASLAPGAYDAIELTMTKLGPADTTAVNVPKELNGASLYLSGELTLNGGTARHFVFTLESEEELKIPAQGASGGVVGTSGVHLPIVVTFFLGRWLDGLGEDLAKLPDGDIILTSAATGPAATIRDQIRRNIVAAAEFRRDDGQ